LFLLTTIITSGFWLERAERQEKPWGSKVEWRRGKGDMGEMTIFDSDIVGIVKANFGLERVCLQWGKGCFLTEAERAK
ncbi:hypothetical protein, partial [Brevibacillus borstelensis]|uniref:hypothetical protein n=1 Tax=Brevibacillus borstelensis TaxID=45462 RepID=UPI001D151578